MFRPGYIQPMKCVRSKTRLYQTFYSIFGRLYPVLRKLAPRHVTTTENVGRAMIEVAAAGYSRRVLENFDINLLAAKTGDLSRPVGPEAGRGTAIDDAATLGDGQSVG